MSKTKFDTKTRVALWKAGDRRCFYCTEPVSFVDLEIDHIIAEQTPLKELRALIKRIGLKRGFDLNSFANLVPAHHGCNNRKSGENFTDKTLLYYLELWGRKQDRIQREYDLLAKTALRDKQLIQIAQIVDAGDISKQEIVQFVLDRPVTKRSPISEPTVITFSINANNFLRSNELPKEVDKSYVKVCDWLEKDLQYRLLQILPILSQQTEASERNGETLSVRMAFWNLDIERLDELEITPWEIVEIAQFSEIYDTSADELLSKSVVRAYHSLINDPLSYYDGIGKCPRCGSDKLRRWRQLDEERDDLYEGVRCEECGWSVGGEV